MSAVSSPELECHVSSLLIKVEHELVVNSKHVWKGVFLFEILFYLENINSFNVHLLCYIGK
jgi:hypothetical protein